MNDAVKPTEFGVQSLCVTVLLQEATHEWGKCMSSYLILALCPSRTITSILHKLLLKGRLSEYRRKFYGLPT